MKRFSVVRRWGVRAHSLPSRYGSHQFWLWLAVALAVSVLVLWGQSAAG